MDPQRVSNEDIATNPRANASMVSQDDGHHASGDMTLIVGDHVVLNSGQSAIIRFIGPTSFSAGEWVGVELGEASGKNNGSVRGHKYFECASNYGMFLRRSALSRAAGEKPTIRVSTVSVSSPSSPAPRPDELREPPSPMPRKVKKVSRIVVPAGSPRTDQDSANESALMALRQELADASEDHDLDRLRWVVPVARKAGVSSAELESANRILQYEALNQDPQNTPKPCPDRDAQIGDDMLRAAIRDELDNASTAIGHQIAKMGLELRQDFAVLRNEIRAVVVSNGASEFSLAHAGSLGSTWSSSPMSMSQLQNDQPKDTTSPEAPVFPGGRPSRAVDAAGRRLLALVRGGAERIEQRKREAAVNVIQRCVRRLKNRWAENLAKQKACSFAAVAHAARCRNEEWANVFDKCRQGQGGLKQESFVEAMQELISRLTILQCEALYKAYTRGTQKTFLDFRSFARMLEAVHTSDRSAAEFADMTLEEWKGLEQPHVVKTRFAKNRGGANSRASICVQPSQRSVLEEMQMECPRLDFNQNFPIYDIDLHEGSRRQQNIQLYYNICKESAGLLVTTSCFTVWRKKNKTNGCAKLIPAVPMDALGSQSNSVKIFFFDDNLDMSGCEDSPGICNLRDVRTGDFVDFGVGKNGFCCERAARHTIVHASDMYRNVLVKVNILDAIEDNDYFSSIITKFSKPTEKVIIFMDVNSTIVCNDTVQGKDLRGTLLSTMFEFMEIQPRTECDFVWDDSQTIRLEKPMLLRSLVKELTKASAQNYSDFWKESTCLKLLDDLMPLADLRWSLHEGNLTREVFSKLYSDYAAAIEKAVDKEGITSSWFECFKQMKADHTVVLNSFGVDTQKVVIATGLDEAKVLQIAVNYDMWDARDKQKYESLFKPKANDS